MSLVTIPTFVAPVDPFTIIDVVRHLGIKSSGPMNVAVGREASKLFREKYGRFPEHQLREKTFTTGVHCFCTYPGWFWPEVEQIWLGYAKPRNPNAPPPPGMLY